MADLQIDETYEFSAPRFFDFMREETEEEIRAAERWFVTSLSYAPSPFMPKIKVERTVQIDSLCDFGNAEHSQELDPKPELALKEPDPQPELEPKERFDVRDDPKAKGESLGHAQNIVVDTAVNAALHQEMENPTTPIELVLPMAKPVDDSSLILGGEQTMAVSVKEAVTANSMNRMASEVCTPKAQGVLSAKGAAVPSYLKNQTAKKTPVAVTQSAAPMLKKSSTLVQSGNGAKSTSKFLGSSAAKRFVVAATAAKSAGAAGIAQDNQAIKKQKLESGKFRQIISAKSWVLPHKSKLGPTGGTGLFASASKDNNEKTQFISAAEMVRKFQSKTREIDFTKNRTSSKVDSGSTISQRPKLTLTRPKDPEFETAHRVRAVRMKSSAELEEEMLAKIPKFKARELNKKILEAPSLPALPRSTPHPPEFHEFNLKTMERANHHAETSSTVSSKDSSCQQGKTLKLTEPRPPQLETALRARPIKTKTSEELELEELEKIPKFKARPLNKKILETKGDLGVPCVPKPLVTTPQEFHFATDERLGPPAAVADLFDKLSLHSEQDQRDFPGVTVPEPFHLHTEERGLEKEKQLSEQMLRKQLEEEKARIPKANPYPYTTDYPVIPPKPEPKQCTKPEAFQLESLVRHEEEMQRKHEEKRRLEKEEAERRRFKAQPIMKDDPLPLPERQRMPLTEVQEFVHHVDNRAVTRSEFDKKIKEKEMVYKRRREEYELAKLMEEEKALKQMRRTMVPHARPVPKFDNPFHPQKSKKETTKPKSPILYVAQREQHRRHASQMR